MKDLAYYMSLPYEIKVKKTKQRRRRRLWGAKLCNYNENKYNGTNRQRS